MNKIIFDTDIGGDCDDAGALAILHEAQNAGKAELLAVTLSTSSPYAAGCADAINRYYGHIVPIGQTETKAPGGDENLYEDSYGKAISEAFENGYPKEEKPQSAVRLLRRLLAENTGEKITIVAVGNFENLAALLTSGADDISPLTGKELMLAQAKRVVAMACFFPSESVPEVWFGDWKMEAEFNVAVDIPSARTTLEECPVPVYFSHYLTGMSVLPGLESISLCMNNDITGKHILALQGPFSTQLNEALIDQYGIRCLVTKKSGAAGGFIEKIAAAKNKNIPVYIVGQSVQDDGMSFEAVCEYIDSKYNKLHIMLAGIGMGNDACMTKAVSDAIESADIILGASRMIEKYSAKIDKKPYYLAKQIIPYLYEICADTAKISNVLILFSGDTGFYSGSRKLYLAIKNEIIEGKLNADVSILPGISSVSYMAAAVGETYNDAYICSIHGVKLSNITSRISHHAKTFMLMSGVKDVNMLGHLLSSDERYGLQKCSVTVGYQLSYPDETISQLSPQECTKLKREGLYICMIKNPNPVAKNVTPQLSDAAFIREKVPMTKEEIRHVSICKLHLKSDSVLYDVGSGTGSIAVEAASLSDDMEVYAIEQKENAVQLIMQNKEKHGLENIHVINAKAPDGMDTLPMPTHAFIGGSGGNLKEIIEALKEKNPHIRIVINAISMETICEIKEILSAYDVKNEDIVLLQVSRSKQIGHYHLMQAENPVWICSFEF